MDFLNLLATVRRHRLLMAAGVAAGIALVVVARYAVTIADQGLVIEERSLATYTVQSQLIVIDPQFGMGRTSSGNSTAPDMFNKTVDLATTYANLLSSDFAVASAEKVVGPIDVEVQTETVARAPLINLTVIGTDSERMILFSSALSRALEEYLAAEQRARGIDAEERVTVQVLSRPTIRTVQSREWEIALLALITPVFVAYALAVLLDRAPNGEADG